MTSIPSDISPKKVYLHFKKTFEKHPFFSPDTWKDSKTFLRLLKSTEKCLNEQMRNDIYNQLSQLTIKLWCMMLKDALDALDDVDGFKHKDSIRGISRLKSYLKGFKEFEILLYGSDKRYRDTIYHQLWFYFVGEYLFSKYNIMGDLLKGKDWYCDPIDKSEEKILKARYACFCVIALCHDLGKPLQKIHSINDAIRSMLEEYKFLHFSPFKVEFPLTYETMLNFLVERLGQIGIPYRKYNHSTKQSQLDIRKIKDHYYIKMKEYMINQPHMKATFSTALAELNHGMFSCLLLMESFRRFKGGSPYQNWMKKRHLCSLEEIWIQKSYMTAQSILKSIAYHSIDSIQITEIDLPYFWVCLVDDLSEWYRPTRAGKDFISSGICKVRIDELNLSKIHISYVFDKNIAKIKEETIGDDAFHFFIDKIEKYYNLLDLQLEFIIDVKTDGFLMSFYYTKNDKEENVPGFRLKSNKNGSSKKYDKKEIEELLMKDLGEKTEIIREIKSFFKKNDKFIK